MAGKENMETDGQLGQGTSKTTDTGPEVCNSIVADLADFFGQLIVGKGTRDKNEPF